MKKKTVSDIIVFVSYNNKDAKMFKISEIAKKLRNFTGIGDVLYYEQESYDSFVKFMNDNIGKCDVLLLFCSPNSLNSSFVEKEWTAADALGKPIIPMFFKPEYIPPLLSSRVGVELDPNNFKRNIQEIYNIILKKCSSKIESMPKKATKKPIETELPTSSQKTGMKMCIKCNTFLALQGSDYCVNCKPSGTNIGQSQISEGAQQQAQNIAAMGITVSQQQSQASGGAQQQSFSSDVDKPEKPEIMDKLSTIEKDVKDIKKQTTLIIENQLNHYEDLTNKLENLNKKRDNLNYQVIELQSKGDLTKIDEVQQEIEQLGFEIKDLIMNVQDTVDVIAENAIKILEKQDLTEEFLKKYLASDWDKIRISWKEYREGNINKKELIKKIIKTVGILGVKKLIKKVI